eukprot:s2504_g1.t1
MINWWVQSNFPAHQASDPVDSLRKVSKATGHVIEEMQRLQGESWAAGVLAEILEEERRGTLMLPGKPVQMAPKGRRGVLVTSSKKKVILEEDDEKLQSQREWETLAP